jgi:hypothetical protein
MDLSSIFNVYVFLMYMVGYSAGDSVDMDSARRTMDSARRTMDSARGATA